jgi:hypothetical protein
MLLISREVLLKFIGQIIHKHHIRLVFKCLIHRKMCIIKKAKIHDLFGENVQGYYLCRPKMKNSSLN